MSSERKPASPSATQQVDQANPLKQDPKLRRDGVNPFWLEKVFPDASAIFSSEVPPVSEIIKSSIFVLDANVLLAPYEIGTKDFEDVDSIYRKLSKEGRLFVPAQAVREYGKNRSAKIGAVYKTLNDRSSSLPNLAELDCPILEDMPEYKDFGNALNELKVPVKKLKSALHALKAGLLDWGWRDRVSSLYRDVFIDRIVHHDEDATAILADLDFRTVHSTPPGFRDANKLDGGIGDLIIWHTLIFAAKKHQRNVVFVSNDEKNDWYSRSSDEAVLPRAELIVEFYNKTGKCLSLLNWARFLSCMNASNSTVLAAESVAEHMLRTEVPQVRFTHHQISEFDSFCEDASDWYLNLSSTHLTGRRLKSIVDDMSNKVMYIMLVIEEAIASPLQAFDPGTHHLYISVIGSLQLLNRTLHDVKDNIQPFGNTQTQTLLVDRLAHFFDVIKIYKKIMQ